MEPVRDCCNSLFFLFIWFQFVFSIIPSDCFSPNYVIVVSYVIHSEVMFGVFYYIQRIFISI